MGWVTVELEGRTFEREPTGPEQVGALLGDGAVTQLRGVEAVTAPELPVVDPGVVAQVQLDPVPPGQDLVVDTVDLVDPPGQEPPYRAGQPEDTPVIVEAH